MLRASDEDDVRPSRYSFFFFPNDARPKRRRATVVRAPGSGAPSSRALGGGPFSPGRLKKECFVRGDPSLAGAVCGRSSSAFDWFDGDVRRFRVFRIGVAIRLSYL